MQLDGLDELGVFALLECQLGARPAEALLHLVLSATGGNPLEDRAARRRASARSNALEMDGDQVVATVTEVSGLPLEVDADVTTLLAGLSEDARQLLTTLAFMHDGRIETLRVATRARSGHLRGRPRRDARATGARGRRHAGRVRRRAREARPGSGCHRPTPAAIARADRAPSRRRRPARLRRDDGDRRPDAPCRTGRRRRHPCAQRRGPRATRRSPSGCGTTRRGTSKPRRDRLPHRRRGGRAEPPSRDRRLPLPRRGSAAQHAGPRRVTRARRRATCASGATPRCCVPADLDRPTDPDPVPLR